MKQIVKSIFAILSIVFIGISCQQDTKNTTNLTNNISSKSNVEAKSTTNKTTLKIEATKQARIPAELVCMVNDAFMNKKQYPVPVGKKIYFGCCEMCVGKLQNSDKYRYGIDPLTHEKVDKVEAYIVLQSPNTDAVFYFASEENYKKYFEKI